MTSEVEGSQFSHQVLAFRKLEEREDVGEKDDRFISEAQKRWLRHVKPA
jgi:hypothetical protein